jgi:hypothetical protein
MTCIMAVLRVEFFFIYHTTTLFFVIIHDIHLHMVGNPQLVTPRLLGGE